MSYYKILDDEGFVVEVIESDKNIEKPDVIEITKSEYDTLDNIIPRWIPQ